MEALNGTAKKRLAFQKTFSQEYGAWRRKTLIGDAKFETAANKEFQKQERRLSKADSFGGEEGFAPGLLPDAFPDDYLAFNVLVTLREGLVSLARVIRVFEINTLAGIRSFGQRMQVSIRSQLSSTLEQKRLPYRK
ncbi:tyrosine hydroxylase [Plakobranchus ocellatus]|uniref:Tyrosine hydroxylase n=1 Tax=Plakobranchus ocellatus TaxID=259542 RepID=A0AAV4AF99_9GAST|nr:tyrosine hydroxylase [Plakobranchus ocellatus]